MSGYQKYSNAKGSCGRAKTRMAKSKRPKGNKMRACADGVLPAWLERSIDKAEKERRTAVIARPMRNLFDILAQGEAYEYEGKVVMRMPEIDRRFAEKADWVEVAPAIEGWIDCWKRLAPDISTYHMGVLAKRLNANEPITPRLVEQARAEFDATVARLVEIPDGQISSAITTTMIAWEFEKMERAA